MTFWYEDPDPDPDPDLALFVSGFQGANKYNFFSTFIFLLLTLGTFTTVLIESKSLKRHKTVEIRVFFIFFACWWKDPAPYKHTDPGGPKSYGSGSGTLPLKTTNLGMFLHGLLDHDPGVEDLLQQLWETKSLKVMTNLGMFFHGLLDHDPGVEDLLQQLWEANP